MSDTYPQFPSSVWWKLRERFQKSIPSTLSESFVSSELGVQPTAAKAYVKQLQDMGIIGDDGKPTELANDWRMDDTYRAAADKIVQSCYPQELLDLSPPDDFDREKAKRWFMGKGLGSGAASNKAATFQLLSVKPIPNDIPEKKPRKRAKAAVADGSDTKSKAKLDRRQPSKQPPTTPTDHVQAGAPMPLNVNVQIHISADASSEQIEAIFANMRKYLR